jgi:hypothetical protein
MNLYPPPAVVTLLLRGEYRRVVVTFYNSNQIAIAEVFIVIETQGKFLGSSLPKAMPKIEPDQHSICNNLKVEIKKCPHYLSLH